MSKITQHKMKLVIILFIFALSLSLFSLVKPSINSNVINVNDSSNEVLENDKVRSLTQKFIDSHEDDEEVDAIVVFKDGIKEQNHVKSLVDFKAIQGYKTRAKVKDLKEIVNNPAVKYVEIDQKIKIPEDDLQILPLNLDDSGLAEEEQQITWGIKKIKADLAWNNVTGRKIKIAILDTGVSEHPDLLVREKLSFTDGSGEDVSGHGTHVAGIVGALNNDDGIVGVAPDVEIYSLQVMDPSGGYLSDAIAAIEWAIDHDIDIISMSFGFTEYSQAFKDIVYEAYNEEILLVAAAGNTGDTYEDDDIDYPARYDNVIAVGAINENNERMSWSSDGPELEFVAPGERILSTYLEEEYAYSSGTSMAAPFVTGILALLKEQYSGYSNDEIRQKLQQDAVDLGIEGRDNFYGYGLGVVNLDETVEENKTLVNETILMNYSEFSINIDRLDSLLEITVLSGAYDNLIGVLITPDNKSIDIQFEENTASFSALAGGEYKLIIYLDFDDAVTSKMVRFFSGDTEIRLSSINDTDDDGDGLSYSEELEYGTNPNLADTDEDGVNDYDEIFIYKTHPTRETTDGDKYDDGQEIYGHSPYGLGELGGDMPGYVKAPGDNVFVAAFPDIDIEVSDEIEIEIIKEITIGHRTMNSTSSSHEVETKKETYSSRARSEGLSPYVLNKWQDRHNKVNDKKQLDKNEIKLAEPEMTSGELRILGKERMMELGPEQCPPAESKITASNLLLKANDNPVMCHYGYINPSASVTTKYFGAVKNKPLVLDNEIISNYYTKQPYDPSYSGLLDIIITNIEEGTERYSVNELFLVDTEYIGITPKLYLGNTHSNVLPVVVVPILKILGGIIIGYVGSNFIDEKLNEDINRLKKIKATLMIIEQGIDSNDDKKVIHWKRNSKADEFNVKYAAFRNPYNPGYRNSLGEWCREYYAKSSECMGSGCKSLKCDDDGPWKECDCFCLKAAEALYESRINRLPSDIIIPKNRDAYRDASKKLSIIRKTDSTDAPFIEGSIDGLPGSVNDIIETGNIDNMIGMYLSLEKVDINSNSLCLSKLMEQQSQKRIFINGKNSGSEKESIVKTSSFHSSYKLTAVKDVNTIASEEEWSSENTTYTDRAAKLKFTFNLKNDGTDVARDITDLRFNIWIGDSTIPITYPALTDEQGHTNPGISFTNLIPNDNNLFQAEVILSLDEVRKIDEGGKVKIQIADYSYGIDQLFFENALGKAVLFEIDDGVSDGDEAFDKYLIATWNNETYLDALSRYISIDVRNETLYSINNQEITEWSHWNIFISRLTDGSKFVNTKASADTRVIMRYYQDSDHDNINDRTEMKLGTDPNDASSYPYPILNVGATYLTNGSNVTVSLAFENSGNYDAFGVEARLYSLDNTTQVIDGMVGGSGRVKAGERVIPENDNFQFTFSETDFTQPVILVEYNDPQGHHTFITEINLSDLNEPIPDEKIEGLNLETATQSLHVYNMSNPTIVSFKNPLEQTLEGANIYVTYQTLNGIIIYQENVTTDLKYGHNNFLVNWTPSEYMDDYAIGLPMKVFVVVTDYQNVFIDSSISRFVVASEGFVDGMDAKPDIVVSNREWLLGIVPNQTRFQKGFTILNEGKGPLHAIIVTDPKLMLHGSGELFRLESGEQYMFNVSLITNDLLVEIHQNAYIYSDDPERSLITIPVICGERLEWNASGHKIIYESIPKDSIVLESYLTIFGDGKSHDHSLDIGNDGDYEFLFDGTLSAKVIVHNISNEIMEYLENCVPDGEGYCEVPFVFSLNSSGHILIVEKQIDYKTFYDDSPTLPDLEITYHRNLMSNGDFEEPYSTGWSYYSSGQIERVTNGDSDSDNEIYLKKDLSYGDETDIFQTVSVTDPNVIFSGKFKANGESIYSPNYVTAGIIFGYLGSSNNWLGWTRFIWASKNYDVPDSSTHHHYHYSNDSWHNVNLNISHELDTHLEGINKSKVKKIRVMVIASSKYAGSNKGWAEVYADDFLLYSETYFRTLILNKGVSNITNASYLISDPNDNIIYEDNLPTLHGGEEYQLNLMLDNVTLLKHPYVKVILDPNNLISEVDEYNNELIIPLLSESPFSYNIPEDSVVYWKNINKVLSESLTLQRNATLIIEDSVLTFKSYSLLLDEYSTVILLNSSINPDSFVSHNSSLIYVYNTEINSSEFLLNTNDLTIKESEIKVSSLGYGKVNLYDGSGRNSDDVSLNLDVENEILIYGSNINVFSGDGEYIISGNDCDGGSSGNVNINVNSVDYLIMSKSNLSFWSGDGGKGATISTNHYLEGGWGASSGNLDVMISSNNILLESSNVVYLSGKGGKGGRGSRDSERIDDGGDGGKSADAGIINLNFISDDVLFSKSNLTILSGEGGGGGDGGSGDDGGKGRNGGYGGSIHFTIVSETISINESNIVLQGGDGGWGGDGGYGADKGGDGGSGQSSREVLVNYMTAYLALYNSNIVIISGDGGEGGNDGNSKIKDIGNSGSGGSGNQAIFNISTSDKIVIDSVNINIKSGDGGDGYEGGMTAGNGGDSLKSIMSIKTEDDLLITNAKMDISTGNGGWGGDGGDDNENGYNGGSGGDVEDAIIQIKARSAYIFYSQLLTKTKESGSGGMGEDGSDGYGGNGGKGGESCTSQVKINSLEIIIINQSYIEISSDGVGYSGRDGEYKHGNLGIGTHGAFVNKSLLNIYSNETIISNSEVKILGGDGGRSGDGGRDTSTNERKRGGDGSVGGNAEMRIGSDKVELNHSKFSLIGGLGGDGGASSGSGGNGGNGGDCHLVISSQDIKLDFVYFDILSGDGGLKGSQQLDGRGGNNKAFLNGTYGDFIYTPITFTLGSPILDNIDVFELKLKNYNSTENSSISPYTVLLDFFDNLPKEPMPPQIDFYVTSDDIFSSTAYLIEGERISLSANITNYGNITAPSFMGLFYDGEPLTDGSLIGYDAVTVSLLPNESVIASVDWDTSGLTGAHDIYVVIDPYNAIPEINETNNIAHKTFIVLDSGNKYIDAGATSDTPYNSANYKGYIDGYPFTAWGAQPYQTLRYDTDGELTYRFDNLNSDKDYYLNLTFYEEDNKNRSIETWIDNHLEDTINIISGEIKYQTININKSYYSDNTINITFKSPDDPIINEIWLVEGIAKPDLTVEIENIEVSSLNIKAGDPVEITSRIKNQGRIDVESVNITYYIDDTIIQTKTIYDLSSYGGEKQDSITWNASSGEHSVLVKVDAESAVDESNGENNEALATISVSIYNVYINCGTESDIPYAGNYGYIDGEKDATSGQDPHETIHYDNDGDLTYRFDNLNPKKRYTFNLTFFDDERIQNIYVNENIIGNIDLTDGKIHNFAFDVPQVYLSSGSINLTIRSTGLESAIISEILLMEGELLNFEPATLSISSHMLKTYYKENFTLDIVINSSQPIYGAGFELYFDPAVISAQSISEGTFFSQDNTTTISSSDINNTIGRIRFDISRSVAQENINGLGMLATLRFEAISNGTSNITINNAKAQDLNSKIIDTKTKNGAVIIKLIKGDINDDCIVGVDDLVIMGGSYFSICGDERYRKDADINMDCSIDISDLVSMGKNYFKTCDDILKGSSIDAKNSKSIEIQSAGNDIWVDPLYKEVYVNDTFNVNINISASDQVYGYSLSVSYDPHILEAKSTYVGGFLNSDGAKVFDFNEINNTLGKIKFDASRFGAIEGIGGSGKLLNISFEAIQNGTSNISLESVQLLDINTNTLSYENHHGTIWTGIKEDITPPSIAIITPTNESILPTNNTWFNLTTNENSTCLFSLCVEERFEFVGGGSCTEYKNMATIDGVFHAQLIINLNDTKTNETYSKWYSLYANCSDNANNSNEANVIFYVNSTSIIPFPDQTNPPTDPDGDGLYEDINGNSLMDFDDVVQFFKYLEWVEPNQPNPLLFDFNTNSRIDFDDIRKLFNEV